MQYTSKYKSPLGDIVIAADEEGLTGLWFVGQKYFAYNLDKNHEEKDTPVLKDARRWLDVYFSGREPDFKLPVNFIGTDFQKEVWEILLEIPYGETMTYKDIADIIAEKRGLHTMSAQAVGGAVSKNQISLIVPCHRVIGTNGNLIGYAGGIDKKIELLKMEKDKRSNF